MIDYNSDDLKKAEKIVGFKRFSYALITILVLLLIAVAIYSSAFELNKEKVETIAPVDKNSNSKEYVESNNEQNMAQR